MWESLLKNFKQKASGSIVALKERLSKIRTGRANPSLINHLRVACYGSEMTLESLAALSVPESNIIVIQPWDSHVIPDIEKSILTSGLGINPKTENGIIRLVFPPLTGERREELIKLVKQEVESFRVAIRNHRREAIDTLKDLKKQGDISEDEEKRYENEIQKSVDEAISEINHIGEEKEQELQGV